MIIIASFYINSNLFHWEEKLSLLILLRNIRTHSTVTNHTFCRRTETDPIFHALEVGTVEWTGNEEDSSLLFDEENSGKQKNCDTCI